MRAFHARDSPAPWDSSGAEVLGSLNKAASALVVPAFADLTVCVKHVACARALRPEQNPFKLHSDGAFDPFRRAEPPPRERKKPPNCAFLWFLRNNG